MKLPVNEIFETIQGEAFWTGTPAIFIRLQGCDVGCPWCDTKHTWQLDHINEVSPDIMMARKNDAASFAYISRFVELFQLNNYKARHVVITGGEPCDYDLVELTKRLLLNNYTVQIETSGTSEIKVAAGTWVTVSPKIGMPGGKVVLQSALRRANEIKMPVGKPADIERLDQLLRSMPYPADRVALIWLQPLSQSPKATELCVSEATKNGWRVSIQTHKFLGVR